MFGLQVKVKAGTVYAGVKKIADDMPKLLKRDTKRALEWAKEKLQAFGSKGGYSTPWTYLQAIGAKRAYKRTQTLQRGWGIVSAARNAFRLVNKTPWTAIVHGNAYGIGQAEIHRGRWYKAFDVVETAFDTVTRQYLNTSLRDVIRKAGFRGGEAAGL